MDDFELETKRLFLEEAEQLLADAEHLYLRLEQAAGTAPADDPKILEELFRIAHNIKGSAAASGFTEFSDFTHSFESLLLKVKDKQIPVTSIAITLLLECNDRLRKMIKECKDNYNAKFDNTELLSRIHSAVAAATTQAAPRTMDKSESQVVLPPLPKPGQRESLRISIERLDQLINMVGELVIVQSGLSHQKEALSTIPMRRTVRELEKVIKELQQTAMNLRMLPMKQVFRKTERVSRDTAARLNKEIHFTSAGEETEVDRLVLHHLDDPFIHLARNAIDHGIETTEERVQMGKPAAGSVHLSARQEFGQVVLEMRDDGRGLDARKLIEKAIEKRIINQGQTLSDAEAYQLIFSPGFSTKSEATDISGRGVGMDVVKSNIADLQGTIEIETELGKGTCFRIRVPLTLSIIDGMIIRDGGANYVLPISNINESIRPKEEDVHSDQRCAERLSIRGEIIPLFRLSELLGKTRNRRSVRESTAIVIRAAAERTFSILVDEIVSTQQIVIKKLDQEIDQLPWIMGGAILGDGSPSVILDLQQIVEGAA